ncbi:hypothetical protein A9G28_06375 [Gilliamella sp. Fer1-1]|jgi:hypothetical protein|nr:hypothetical protein [Gilliamella apicola]OCG24158.1 hypothetical protein A9G46_09100 [Gilliamella apicola]OCG26169.1 hypothetical protein A9G45_11650 [Gilliamella apicola]OCG32498.1 hypothetical protein A9G29_05530 [Gilliamella apicola]OCG41277.1 hypothetical protein A9G28_06375 [Gilliamella apicola]
MRSFKTDEQEMANLTKKQIDGSLLSCEQSTAKDLTVIVKICLATDARWSEPENLKALKLKTVRSSISIPKVIEPFQ